VHTMMKQAAVSSQKVPSSSDSDKNGGTTGHDSLSAESLALEETQAVRRLRVAVLSVLVLSGIVMSAGVFLYSHNQELENFTTAYEDSAQQVIDAFHDTVERNLNAMATLSTDITSYALSQNQSFPFVTLPNFALKGSNIRSLSGSHMLHYIPIVKEQDRAEWEEYAYENRFHIDEAYEEGKRHRDKQDAQIGRNMTGRQMQPGSRESNATMADDDTGYHMKIWRGTQDEPDGGGIYMPLHQRSPISRAKQRVLNMNVAPDLQGTGVLECILAGKEAVVENAVAPDSQLLEHLEENLSVSQYREDMEEYSNELSTYFDYPVFESFQDNKTVAGVLTSNIYWKNLFSNLLPSRSQGIMCVVENSFQQTFTYRIDGPRATFLGMDDYHESKYDDLEISANVNNYLRQRANVKNRAYETLGLSDKTQYTIHVFPSQATENVFVSNLPIVYTVIPLAGMCIACIVFLWFSYAVERRHGIMFAKVVENAERVATTERELNEFLAHEVRCVLPFIAKERRWNNSCRHDES